MDNYPISPVQLGHFFHIDGKQQKAVSGTTPKVLTKELQQLEDNLLVVRTVDKTKLITVSYALTEHAMESRPVLGALIKFGLKHRKKIRGKLKEVK